MLWWAWLLVGWSLVAVLFALFAGAAVKVIEREERSARPFEPPARRLGDAIRAPEPAALDPGVTMSSWQSGFSAGSRAEPRR